MENRDVSILIPYQIKNEEVLIFLQKREKNKKALPGHFAFFGGKLEDGETPDQALEREIREELCFTAKGYEFLGRYGDTVGGFANVYFLKIGDDFEKEIKVMEGEYGKFFSEKSILIEQMIADGDKNIIEDF